MAKNAWEGFWGSLGNGGIRKGEGGLSIKDIICKQFATFEVSVMGWFRKAKVEKISHEVEVLKAVL